MAINISTTPAAHATIVGNYQATQDAVASAVPRLAFAAYGKREMIRERTGNKAGWYVKPDPRNSPTATAEGTTMSATNAGALNRSIVTATIVKFEDAIVDSELFYAANPFDFYMLNREWVIESAALSLDTYVRDTILADAGLVDVFANNKATGTITVTDLATLDDFTKLRARLVIAKAPTFRILGKDVYVAIVGPYTHGQLLRNTAYLNATVNFISNEGAGDAMPVGLVRMVAGFAFVETANTQTGTFNSITCERNIVFGAGMYGVTALPVVTAGNETLNLGNGPALPAATATESELNVLASAFRVSMVGFDGEGDKTDINNTTRGMGYAAYFGATTLKVGYGFEFIAPQV